MDLVTIVAIFGTPGGLAIGAGVVKIVDRFSTARKEKAEREAAERKLAADRELAEDEAQRKHAMDLGAALSSGAAAQERSAASVAALVSVIEGLRGELTGHNRTISEIDARGARLEASATERGERMRAVVDEQRASMERVERLLLLLAGDVRELVALSRNSAAPPGPHAELARGPAAPAAPAHHAPPTHSPAAGDPL